MTIKAESERRLRNWDYYFGAVKEIEIPDEQKNYIIQGVEKIRNIFGNDWLAKAWDSRHPIIWQIANRAPWSQNLLADFGHDLELLKHCKGFEELKGRLMVAKAYPYAHEEFGVAAKLLKNGFPVEFLSVRGDRKKPDLKSFINDKEVYIEITILGRGEEADKADKTFHQITWPYHFLPGIQVGGKIYRSLSKPRIKELKERIDQAVEKARKEKVCIEISEPGVADCFIFPQERLEEFKKWSAEKNLQGTWEGPEFDTHTIRRLRRAIEVKSNQLPSQSAGVLVIRDNSLILNSEKPGFDSNLVYQLEETIYDQPQLSAVILVSSSLAGKADKIERKENYVVVKKDYMNVLTRYMIIILNKYALRPLKTEDMLRMTI